MLETRSTRSYRAAGHSTPRPITRVRVRALVAVALTVGAVAALAPLSPARGQARAQGAGGRSVRDQIHAYRARHEGAIVRELAELLAIPNVARDSANIRRNADLLVRMLRARGADARLLEAPGSPPAVLGELRAPGARRTVVFYAHYDGQPVDTTQWATPPWRPVLRDKPVEDGGRVIELPDAPGATLDPEWRLYARSASDDKAPIVAMMAALDALKAARIAPSVNIKFFFEGGEEAGSPRLRELLTSHADALRADAWVFCDGPVHQTRRTQVVFGVRGTLDLEMTVYGPSRALHDGHYGNWAPNPAALLATLLAGMRDADGTIRIANFGDDVRAISGAEQRALAELPDNDAELRQTLALGATEGGGARLAERIMLPALNIRGIHVGQTGALASNTIHTQGRASIDFRLVPDQTPGRVRELVEAHLRAQGYHVVREEPDAATRRAHPRVVRLEWGDGYPGVRTDMALPFPSAVVRVVEQALGGPVVKVPTLGGSLPLYDFQDVLRTPLVIVPIANHDNNQHAANENLRIQNLWDGIEVLGSLMARLGTEWP